MHRVTFIKYGILENNICDIWQWCIYWWSPESVHFICFSFAF